ncbi:MAG: hypothetical protein LBK22_06065 [Tannerella sp.]|jgi:hypothetical protein|nr:hypothetical protein [Tannerella sp.]
MKMKIVFFKLKDSGLLLFAVMLLCSAFGIVDAGAMTADVVAAEGGGVVEHGNNPQSVEFGNENSEDLYLHTIDQEVLKLEPYKFQLDTIARQIKRSRHSDNQIVDYYTDGYLPTETKVATAFSTASQQQAAIDFADNANIAVNETLIVQNVPGYLPGTSTQDPAHDLVLVVVDRDASGKPIVRAVNGSGANNYIPNLAANVVVSRARRAASELQIRTDIFTSIPTKKTQFLQKFIVEVEESTFSEMADKEVKWDMSDLTERALLEFRREVNNSYWKGVRSVQKIKNKYNRKAEDTYFTEGLWPMAGGDFSFSGAAPTSQTLVDMMQVAFEGPSSNDMKLLLCSSDFLASMEKVQYNQVIYPGERKQIFGFNLASIISKFGELLVSHDKSLNEVGLNGYAFILDVNYLTKWTMGWRRIPIDNVKNGEADSNSVILTECCGLTLKNPEAHIRVSLA